MNPLATRILWLDGGAGFAVGVFVLAFRAWLAELYGFPLELMTLMGAANLGYASYSSTLAVRASSGKLPSRLAVDALIAANALWAVVCVAIVVTHHRSATIVGLVLVAFEAVFVGGLALVERRFARPFAV